MKPSDFPEFFIALHGVEPFPWQTRLALNVAECGAWPETLELPTAAGKTAVIDIAIFMLALQAGQAMDKRSAPLRIFFVIDRRIVVDEAYRRACKIADHLNGGSGERILGKVAEALRRFGGELPMWASIMRGGVYRDNRWARSPIQPTVCISTVDQLGSRLLFRGYGLSNYATPIHAGLIGSDSLIVLDEAHLSRPFEQTLGALKRYRAWACTPISAPFQIVRMSATPAHNMTNGFTTQADDLSHPVLGRRIAAQKLTQLKRVVCQSARSNIPAQKQAVEDENRDRFVREIVQQTREIRDNAPSLRAIGVVVNRVGTARAIFEQLKSDAGLEAVLLTGRVRPFDRDLLLEEIMPRVQAGRDRSSGAEGLLVTVATQCIEVGADFDFDALISECAPMDALRQRLGRLDRLGQLGKSSAIVVVRQDHLRSADDPIYGSALSATWKWLEAQLPKTKKGKPALIDLGTASFTNLCNGSSLAGLEPLRSSGLDAPVLLPAYLDLWIQTSPIPAVDPEPALFLHGPEPGSPDVRIVWRADLNELEPNVEVWTDYVALVPPLVDEALPVPVYAASAWLAQAAPADLADTERTARNDKLTTGLRKALRWRGLNDSQLVSADELHQGDTLVVPASYGGCDRFGWHPDSTSTVRDIADSVASRRHQTPVLRLHPSVLNNAASEKRLDSATTATLQGLLEALDRDAPDSEIKELIINCLVPLTTIEDLDQSVRRSAEEMVTGGDFQWTAYPDNSGLLLEGYRRQIATGPPLEFTDEDETSCMTRVVSLADHSAGVRDYARQFGNACGLPASIVDDLALAGWLHDVGKADRRFQIMLNGGSELAYLKRDELLAKSGMDPRNRTAFMRALELSGYPKGGRHECQSVALVQSEPGIMDSAHDMDLVLYLIGSHHGRGRPFMPVIFDDSPVEITFQQGECLLSASSLHGLERLSSGVSERFWRMVRKYGWYGLAYLEAVLRLADHVRSEEERRGK